MARDSRYSWLVCGAAFCTLFITLGLHYSCGVIFVALLDHFGEGKAKTAWVQSISQFMIFFCASFVSVLTERYGARTVVMLGGLLMSIGLLGSSYVHQLDVLYITYGVLFGFGTALAYLPTLVMIGEYFEKHRALATGIATCGSNTGALSLAIIQGEILKHYGWQNVFRFTGAFSLLIIVCGVIFRPLVENNYQRNTNRAKWSFKQKASMLMRNRKYCVWCLATTVGCFGYFIPHIHLIRYAEEINISSRRATLLISFMSAASGVGKIFYGRISDYFQRRTSTIYVVSMFLSGVASVVFSFLSTTYTGLVMYTVVLGFLDGSYIGLMSVMSFKCAGSVETMSQGWGMSLMFMSFSMLVGPPTVGWLKSVGISYRCLFYLAGCPMILGALILAPIIWMNDDMDLMGENSVVLMNDQTLIFGKHTKQEMLTVV